MPVMHGESHYISPRGAFNKPLTEHKLFNKKFLQSLLKAGQGFTEVTNGMSGSDLMVPKGINCLVKTDWGHSCFIYPVR